MMPARTDDVMTTFDIRAARAADLPAVVALLSAAELPSEDLTAPMLQTFTVAATGDTLAGAGGLEIYGPDALLRSLVLDPRHRGQGLGCRLLRALESGAIEQGVGALYLLTTTAESFFLRAGYTPFERARVPAAIAATREFAELCPDAAICLSRRL